VDEAMLNLEISISNIFVDIKDCGKSEAVKDMIIKKIKILSIVFFE
jgi:hypothetical protein